MKYISKSILKNLDIGYFTELFKDQLQGAAIFVKNDKYPISKLISFTCKKQIKFFNNFVPSHIASCFKGDDGVLYLLDIKPPKSSVKTLFDYLSTTSDDYVIFLRQENINLDKYNSYMQERIGLWYGLISAIQSVFKHLTFKHGMHCSENYIYAYNQQGFYYDINANKSTPASLMNYLIEKYL